jgi:hypothetical protein
MTNVLWCPITLLFCISHIFNGLTVPSMGVVSLLYRQRLLEKEVAYPLTLLIRRYQQFVLVLN